MESNTRRDGLFYFQTTDDFSFSQDSATRDPAESRDEVLHISFGPTRLSLTRAAAQDLSYRLASFLTFLEYKLEYRNDEPVRSQTPTPQVSEPPPTNTTNVISLHPRSTPKGIKP
ncbi:MAG: hypothetical protein RBT63_00265 [Bdellovibrionales bacterium]|jgi:hypothetical protein|nr:hypothetical protein [Bdellovibrionales bacterium]